MQLSGATFDQLGSQPELKPTLLPKADHFDQLGWTGYAAAYLRPLLTSYNAT